jgi:hypothetical protein
MKTRKSIWTTSLIILTLLSFACGVPGSIVHAQSDEDAVPGTSDDNWAAARVAAQAPVLPVYWPVQVTEQKVGEIKYVFNTPYQYEDIHLKFKVYAVPDSGTCEMEVHAYDVDRSPSPDRPHEQDEVRLNGHPLGSLQQGETKQWLTTTFAFSCSFLREGSNRLDILVDVLDGNWATSIAWIVIRGEGLRGHFGNGCRVIDAGGVVAYYQEVDGEPRFYSVDAGTTFIVGWKDNRPENPTNNVETTAAKGNVGVIFCWDPSAPVALEVAGWVGGQRLPTRVPVGLTADDFRREAVYDPQESAWYLSLKPGQAWTDYCLFDPMHPCIFVANEKPAQW